MKVGSFCSSDVITAEATDTLQEAAARMSRSHVGVLAVVDGGELVGLISEADLVTAIAEEVSLSSASVADYMTEDPIGIGPDEDATVAARRMVENGIGYLLVMQRGAAVGVVSRGDLLAAGAASGRPGS